MTQRLYLHVASPKAGSSYVQAVMRRNQEQLAEAGVLVVGHNWLELVHAGFVVRNDPRLEGLDERAHAAFDRCVEQVLSWRGESAVWSYELMAGATAEQAEWALAAFEGIEVHLVVTARDFGKALPSAWQERNKYGQPTRLEGWRPRGEEGGPRAEWAWRTMDPFFVTERWGATLPREQVHIVTLPPSGAAPDELWRRFAEACGMAQLELDLDVPRVNESLSAATAEVLRRVNEQLAGRFRGPEVSRWIRDRLANDVLVPLDKRGLGITDEQYAKARERSEACVRRLRARGYPVHGDLDELLATRPEGPLPSDVPEGELLDIAVKALTEFMVAARDRERAAAEAAATPPPAPPPSRPLGRIRRRVRGLL